MATKLASVASAAAFFVATQLALVGLGRLEGGFLRVVGGDVEVVAVGLGQREVLRGRALHFLPVGPQGLVRRELRAVRRRIDSVRVRVAGVDVVDSRRRAGIVPNRRAERGEYAHCQSADGEPLRFDGHKLHLLGLYLNVTYGAGRRFTLTPGPSLTLWERGGG